MRLCISIASILLVTTPAVAAVITVREQTPDRPSLVVVEGSLAAFDEDQFAAKAASLSSAFVAFSSDGGSLLAGLRIGEAIRRIPQSFQTADVAHQRVHSRGWAA
jgi:hypothetical protein